MIRSAKLPVAFFLGALLLLAPAGRACGEFARMASDCPMSEMGTVPAHAEALPSHGGGGHGGHSSHAMEPATVPTPEVRCHEPGQSAADCCLTDTAPGETDALVFATPKLDVVLAALAAGGTSASLVPALGESRAAWVREPPPLDELPRYARFSSYLL